MKRKKMTAKEVVLDGRYYALNAIERDIVDAWIKGGMTKQAAVDMLYNDERENIDRIPEYFAKPGIVEALSESHPAMLVRQMANEILRLRQPPPAQGGTPRTEPTFSNEGEKATFWFDECIKQDVRVKQLERELAEKTQHWQNVVDSLPKSVGTKGRWSTALFYCGYWYVKKSHAEAALSANARPAEQGRRLVYNKITKKIDVVRKDGLVADSFDPPEECQ